MPPTTIQSPTLDEPLAQSAPIAFRLAHEHCTEGPTGCRAYHSMWQYFRLIGLISTIRTNSAFLMETLQRLAHPATCRRVLISATADYGMLAHLVHAYRRAPVEPDITVVDLCETPLALNRWYAEQYATEIRTCRSDIRHYRNDEPFDLICTHSFLGRLTPQMRSEVVGAWRALLHPGGRVVTAARVRHGVQEVIHFSEQEVQDFHDRALALARSFEPPLDLPPEQIAEAARHYAATKESRSFGSIEALRACFEDHGFGLEQFDSGGEAERRIDRPSGPSRGWKSERIRIAAVRR